MLHFVSHQGKANQSHSERHLTLAGMAIIRRTMANAGKDVERRELCAPLVGTGVGMAVVESSKAAPQETKKKPSLSSRRGPLGYTAKEMKSHTETSVSMFVWHHVQQQKCGTSLGAWNIRHAVKKN